MSFLNLFRPAAAPSDGLTQPEREAIADLLHYGMYVDNHVAMTEDAVIDDTVAHMNWSPTVSFEAYEARSIALAREAKEHAEARSVFLMSIRQRLASKASRDRALALCASLFSSDGTTETESVLLTELKRLLA